MRQKPWVDGIFDASPRPFGNGPVDPLVYDGSLAARRQRTVNFAAKRYADMMFVTGLDRATADRHFRLRVATVPSGLDGQPDSPDLQPEAQAAFAGGRLTVTIDAADRRATVRWDDPAFAAPVIGQALTRPGYGSILLGPHAEPGFDPAPIAREFPHAAGRPWPLGDAVDTPPAPPRAVAAAADTYFAESPGTYGVLIARPDRVLFERYSAFGAPDRATPSWSMTKAITCTVIGRLIQEGWLNAVHDPAPAPLWSDPRAIHRLITLDHLVRMRSGLGMPVRHEDGSTYAGYENSGVYQDAGNAYEIAQRSIVTTVPGSVYRYVNSGLNVLGSIIRDRIERRGLPYYPTAYGLLVDRLGMRRYQHSADIAGNLIASGAGYATLRDYARLGVLYLNDGVWNGEQLLPPGWADYALTATHAGTSYAACFRTNADRAFPDLPPDAAWASGASDQRIFILRRARLTVAVANETDHPISPPALNRLVAAAIASYA
ncbi:serine hydrolase domain-containing protein [Rhodopila sp.]|jgi:CubicO group peptidase (beta-lactamase class C family)|uniref:serine hydrolase domain-containing protein n=1 Tax=Rhodopila sp. TaxID=2480087 RepID=UPI002CF7D0AF|nr:serine hydrolase [Rhodopila sp.]HVZ09027.1 serine hydrolase [Rhodopila sp.]